MVFDGVVPPLHSDVTLLLIKHSMVVFFIKDSFNLRFHDALSFTFEYVRISVRHTAMYEEKICFQFVTWSIN